MNSVSPIRPYPTTVCPICQATTESDSNRLKVCSACIEKLKAECGIAPKFSVREESTFRMRV